MKPLQVICKSDHLNVSAQTTRNQQKSWGASSTNISPTVSEPIVLSLTGRKTTITIFIVVLLKHVLFILLSKCLNDPVSIILMRATQSMYFVFSDHEFLFDH